MVLHKPTQAGRPHKILKNLEERTNNNPNTKLKEITAELEKGWSPELMKKYIK